MSNDHKPLTEEQVEKLKRAEHVLYVTGRPSVAEELRAAFPGVFGKEG